MKIMKRLWMILPLLMLGQTAHAVAPANAIIINTATLTYTGNATGITASVNVGVALSPTAVTLSAPTNNTVAEAQANVITYTIKANANGPDTYNLTSLLNKSNITGTPVITFKDTAAVPNTITSVVLGATAADTLASAGATTISVPADGTADSNLNGIANGDEINIGGVLYIVNVADSATGSSTITIIAGTLSTGAASPTVLAANVAIGTLIAEQQVFTMNIDNVGTITVAGTAATDTVISTATSATLNTAVASDTHVTTVVAITFKKYVRNVTDAAANPATGGVAIGGSTYYPTQATLVSSVSTDVLEYAIRVITPVGAGIAGALIKDAVPTFTTYVASSTRLNAITVVGDGATSPLAAVTGLAIDDDAVRAAGVAASGNIALNSSAVVTFQVTVD